MKNILFWYLSVFVTFNAFSLETDNYLVWNRVLRDSAGKINSLFEQEINSVLSEVNSSSQIFSCEKVTLKIANRFKTYPPFKIFIEDWLVDNLDEDQIYPRNMDYIKESIYQNTYGFFLKHIPLSPNLQVSGIYFGTDKLSHFTSTGRRYLSLYLKKRLQGFGDFEATRAAIDYGILNETTLLGLKTVGVFSYGDLEANYQGFSFYKNLCLIPSGGYLSQNSSGLWRMVKTPNIREYVSPFWDETYNLSFRSEKNWSLTSKVIQQKYCNLYFTPQVQERMNYYNSLNHRSFSLDYIRSLWSENSSKVPNPNWHQRPEILCN